MGEAPDTADVVRFPKAKAHYWRRDGAIDPADQDKLVWAICPYLRNMKDCRGCPEWEDDPDHGPVKRMCRGIAQEVVNICQTGDPWRRMREESSDD